jgi:hypothetical protein
VLFIVVAEAEVLKFVVDAIANIVGYLLRQGVSAVGAGEVENTPRNARAQYAEGHHDQGAPFHIPTDNAIVTELDQLVDGLAEKVRQEQGKTYGSEKA